MPTVCRRHKSALAGLACWLLLAGPAAATEWVAHRATIAGLPENSLAAMQCAWAAGVSSIELDIRLSADHVVYSFHDEELDGMDVGILTHGAVERRSGQDAPTLAEILALGEPPGRYLLDLKRDSPAFRRELLRVLRRYELPPERLAFQSGYPALLRHLRRQFPTARLHFLSRAKRRLPWLRRPDPAALAARAQAAHADVLSFKGRRFVDHDFVRAVQDTGIELFIWTLNDPARAQHYRQLGVDGVITDRAASFDPAIDANRLPPACSP